MRAERGLINVLLLSLVLVGDGIFLVCGILTELSHPFSVILEY